MAEGGFLDNYAPFDGDDDPPPPKRSSSPQISGQPADSGCPLTAEQLAAYEEDVRLLEMSVNNQERQSRDGQSSGLDSPPNWPRFYPIVHYNIEEVAEGQRGFVHEALFSWMLMAIVFFLNWIGCMCLITVSDEAIGSPGSKIALSSLYIFVVVPLALDLDAMSVYRALSMSGGTLSYVKIFASLGLTIAFEVMMFFGLDDSGSVGIISTIGLFAYKHVGLGVFGCLVSLGFAVCVGFHAKRFIMLWKFYRGTIADGDVEGSMRRGVAQFMVETMK